MNKELINKVISYNYNEFGKEFGDCIVDMKNEIERLKEIFESIVIIPNEFNSGYELYGLSKQELYAILYVIRNRLLGIKYGKKLNEIYFEESKGKEQ